MPPLYKYARKRSLRRLCFYTCLSVILFPGGCLPQCMLRYTRPQSRHPPPPRADTPPHAVHAGRYGQQAGGTHSTKMHTCYVMEPQGGSRISQRWYQPQKKIGPRGGHLKFVCADPPLNWVMKMRLTQLIYMLIKNAFQ